METLDWTKLAGDVTPDTKRIPYEANKHLVTKVAFDVFKMNNTQTESLWLLETDSDGKQYLSACYDETPEKPLEIKSNWLALSDRGCTNVTLIYKDVPIQRFASSDFGFTKDDVYVFQKALTDKLSSDKSFVEKLLKSQPKDKQEMFLSLFPELA